MAANKVRPDINLDEKLLLCAACVIERGETCDFETLVAECFQRYPEDFGLKRYPHWPDSARVNKSWLRCRTDRGWLAGTASRGLWLTAAGNAALSAARRMLSGSPTPESDEDDRCAMLIRRIRTNAAFIAFAHKGTIPTREQVCEVLGVVLETPRRLTRANLREAQACAKLLADAEVMLFLKTCEHLLALARPWRKVREPGGNVP